PPKKKMMKNEPKAYEILEHTADIGIRVFAKDINGLFCNAAYGMCDLIAGKKGSGRVQPGGGSTNIDIEVCASDREELLIAWLSELLTHIDARTLMFTDFKILELTAHKLRARATAEALTPDSYDLKTEIKAVTYHQIQLQRQGDTMRAEVFFDV
ncbi:MAG: archease, partial [Candidatus Omnitrophica bacterium]|nr:archease [Candidatus Omnitrophota bacterium]